MERGLRKTILKDYYQAQEYIVEVLEGGINGFVKSLKQYLTPTIVHEQCNLDDDTGKLRYFQTIRDTLENVLVKGEGKFTWHFNGAPKEIKNLLINSENN